MEQLINLLEELNDTIITEDQFDEIQENEFVEEVENNGVSGKDGKSIWYSVRLVDGTEYQVYL